MEFLGLKFVCLCLFLAGCSYTPSEKIIYYKFKIGSNNPIDSVEVVTHGNIYSIQSEKDGAVELKFYLENGRLYILSSLCDTTVSLNLKIGESIENNCKPLFSFLGKRLTILDINIISIKNKTYKIYKIFNEISYSYIDSSTIFWCEEIGIIFIKVEEGEYFELQKCDPILMSILKQEKDFLELWPIPETPPIPDGIGQ